MRQEIVLACGHPAVATHDSGGRLIKCGECDLTSVVQAKPTKLVDYQISALPDQFSFDDAKAPSDEIPLSTAERTSLT